MADSQRIAIVGCGVVSSAGIGREVLGRALVDGQTGVGPITLFDTAGLRCHHAAEIRDFDPHAWLEGQSLRGMSRSAHLACTAASLALADGAEYGADPARTGLVAGTVYGNVQSMVRFDRETFEEGPRFVEATLFPNTVINSPAGFVSIFHRLRGPNTTLSEGVSSSLAAIDYALTLLRRGAAQQVLAGGFEELSQWVHLGLHNAGRLAGSRPGDPERAAPFDPTSTGLALGEAAGFVRLAARGDGLVPLAWIAGQGEAYVARPLGRGATAPDPLAASAPAARLAMVQAMRQAIASAAREPADVDAVYASASGDPRLDALEAEGLETVFGGRLAEMPVVAVKAALGECFGAAALLQIASALHALQKGVLPPTLGDEPGGQALRLAGVRRVPQALQANHILVNAFDRFGTQRSLLLARA